MSWHDSLESLDRFHRSTVRVVTAVLMFVGSIGALGAFLDATIGSGYYDLPVALRWLGVAAFGLLYRLLGLPAFRLTVDALKGATK